MGASPLCCFHPATAHELCSEVGCYPQIHDSMRLCIHKTLQPTGGVERTMLTETREEIRAARALAAARKDSGPAGGSPYYSAASADDDSTLRVGANSGQHKGAAHSCLRSYSRRSRDAWCARWPHSGGARCSGRRSSWKSRLARLTSGTA